MSTNEHHLQVYEAIGQLTDRMLGAARDGEWDRLCALERQCGALVAQLAAGGQTLPSAGELRARKVEIIQKILADDRAIRDLATPWMAELAARMRSTGMARKLTTTYASV